MIFYPLGRIIQNRFNLGKRSLALSIPIGVVAFLVINFFFYLPFNFILQVDQFLQPVNIIKGIFILTIILIYFQEWLPPRIQINFERIRFSNIFALFNFGIFLSAIIVMNIYLADFNHINEIAPKDMPFFPTDTILYSSLLFSNLMNKLFLQTNLLSTNALFKWIYFLILEIIIYLIAQSYAKQVFKNNYLMNVFGMLLAFVLSNYFWISSTQDINIYIVVLLLIAIFFIKFYFSTWSPNSNIIVFSYWTLFSIFSFSISGLLFLFIFWISSILFINNYKSDSAKLFVHGGYLFSISMLVVSFKSTFLIFVLTLFVLCIVFIPFTTNYINAAGPNVESQIKSDRFVFASILLFLFSIACFLILLTSRSIEETKDYFLGFISIFSILAWYWNLLILLLLYFLPCFILLILFFRKFDRSLNWYYIYVFIFVLFMNPFSYYFFYYLFGVQLTVFFWVWPLIIFEIILVNYKGVFIFFKRKLNFKKIKKTNKVNSEVDSKVNNDKKNTSAN